MELRKSRPSESAMKNAGDLSGTEALRIRRKSSSNITDQLAVDGLFKRLIYNLPKLYKQVT
jgi:hypothetical protein